ncbi:MAG: redoxin domain-containing protein [Planctomycetes bacterium]|nr:redoxin domain-containing protein [Planctomycetota bacterium]
MKKSRMMLLARAVLGTRAHRSDEDGRSGRSSPTVAAQDSEFAKLEKEYKEARKAWDAAAKEARAKKEKAPTRVEPDFWARFETIANKGDKDAAAWCVMNLRYANLSNADITAKVPPLYTKLVDAMLKDEKAEKPISLGMLLSRVVPGAVGQQYLTADQAQALFKKVQDSAKEDESKAAALLASLTLPNQSIQDETEREAKNLAAYKVVAEKFPKTSSGMEARGNVNRVENLVEGKVAPDFTTKDVEDVEFKLSDYRGKVVLLDFWGFW